MRAIHTQTIATVKENSMDLSWLVVHQTVTGNSYIFHSAFAHQGSPKFLSDSEQLNLKIYIWWGLH